MLLTHGMVELCHDSNQDGIRLQHNRPFKSHAISSQPREMKKLHIKIETSLIHP